MNVTMEQVYRYIKEFEPCPEVAEDRKLGLDGQIFFVSNCLQINK